MSKSRGIRCLACILFDKTVFERTIKTNKIILQARNKPADGSGHLTQKQREKTPSGQKGGAPAKASAHSAKQPAPAKQTPSNKSSTPSLYKPQPKPVPKQKPKKKKNQQHDLIVTIDLVSILILLVLVDSLMMTMMSPKYFYQSDLLQLKAKM